MRSLEVVHAVPPQTPALFAAGVDVAGFCMTFSRNEEIFGEDEPAEFAYKVVSGVVRTLRFLDDGRRLVVGFHMPGEVFGMELCPTHRTSAEAVGACEVMLVRRVALQKAAACDPAVGAGLWALTDQHLQCTQAHMMLLGRRTAAERVEAFLADMAERAPACDGVDLPMSRTDIADYLGLTIETVSRILSQMERENRINRATSRHVVLCDRRLLQAAA
ncbi:helix-turn-helix domain-containing protein [Caulobacter segnis]|uniref:helix-turn-helix domain-containing protein n=1 Tax=Caulobacter segnis TaxID=88688 RepID=UPI00240EE6B7|nr:helix-turn-helix domain-containing protein [Caulobacter segnis]MDG2520257.1 helix-turn-helix domain-containing protein [Caulobacter segnis]